MLDKVLITVIDELNNYLKIATGSASEASVVLADLVNQRGDISYAGEDKIICTLFNVGQDQAPTQLPLSPAGVKSARTILLNLDVFLSAYFSGNYKESLRQLSMVITFFQQMQVFTTPAMPAGVDKVTAELLNLPPETSSQLWKSFGARRMPFVAVRLRVVTIPEVELAVATPEVVGNQAVN